MQFVTCDITYIKSHDTPTIFRKMKLKLEKPLIVFDLETTGLDIVNDHIFQISYIKAFPDGTEKQENIFVNPAKAKPQGKAIPQEVAELTGTSQTDVNDKPAFEDVVHKLAEEFRGCDFAGFNSNHFDVPMLAEEFAKHGVAFDFSKCRLIDVQTIFHKMEKRNLAAAYKFYCGRKMEDDFKAHSADQDTMATWKVLQGELDMYCADGVNYKEGEKDETIENSVKSLAEFSKQNDNVDFAGRMVWKEVRGADGKPVCDAQGNPVKQEVFNFGKYKNVPVVEVLHRDPGYYGWIQKSDFTFDTKQALTRIYMRDLGRK